MNRWEREVRERESARLQRNEIRMRFYRGAFSNSDFFLISGRLFPYGLVEFGRDTCHRDACLAQALPISLEKQQISREIMTFPTIAQPSSRENYLP